MLPVDQVALVASRPGFVGLGSPAVKALWRVGFRVVETESTPRA